MRAKRAAIAVGSLILLVSGLQAEDAQSKIQAYQLAVSSRGELSAALPGIDLAISQAKAKADHYQSQVDDGVSSATILLNLFQKKLVELKKTKAETQSRIDQLEKIIEALKKDPDVGSQVTSAEALSQMKEKLEKASSILPKSP